MYNSNFGCKDTKNINYFQILQGNYLADQKIITTFAPLTVLFNLNRVRMKKKKAEKCVKSGKMLGSVESFNYFCR